MYGAGGLFPPAPRELLQPTFLKENLRPVALKCRHVAHALKPPVKIEIERLTHLGHLEPLDVSEWATPIVSVLKGNGNPYIIIDEYPLHSIDEIFTKLQGGITFTELDMTHQCM